MILGKLIQYKKESAYDNVSECAAKHQRFAYSCIVELKKDYNKLYNLAR